MNITESTPVEMLGLQNRSKNCLVMNGYRTVGDVWKATDAELMMSPNMGRKSLHEIRLLVGYAPPARSVNEIVKTLRREARGDVSAITEALSELSVQMSPDMDVGLVRAKIKDIARNRARGVNYIPDAFKVDERVYDWPESQVISVKPKMRVAEAAEYLALSTSTLNKLRLTGGGPTYIKLGKTVVYDINDLNEWLSTKRQRSTSDVSLR